MFTAPSTTPKRWRRGLASAACAAALLAASLTPASARAVPEIPAQPHITQLTVPMKVTTVNLMKVSGKYCPKYKSNGSVYDRTLIMSKSLKKNTKLCDMTRTQKDWNLTVNSRMRLYKLSNTRIKVVYNLTTKTYKEIGHWLYTATAYSLAQTSQSTVYFDGGGSVTFGSVAAKPFTTKSLFTFCQIFDGKADGCWDQGPPKLAIRKVKVVS